MATVQASISSVDNSTGCCGDFSSGSCEERKKKIEIAARHIKKRTWKDIFLKIKQFRFLLFLIYLILTEVEKKQKNWILNIL